MILHTNIKVLFVLTIFLLFSCKKASTQQVLKEPVAEDIQKKQELKKSNEYYALENIFSLSPESNYSCSFSEYESLILELKGDSVLINNNYTDDVYTNIISSKSYFSSNYLLEAYKKRLKEELNIEIPNEIKTIRNKRTYDKNSLLDKYFKEAFFIENDLFFENNGCIIHFKKQQSENGKTVKTSNYEAQIIFPIDEDNIETKKWLDNNRFINYNQILNLPNYKNFLVFVAKNDLSDDTFLSLFVVDSKNKILDSLKIAYVEDSYPESDLRRIVKFKIEKDYKITLNKYKREGYENTFESNQKYEITEKGSFKKIN